MADNSFESAYALDAGKLFIAAGNISEDNMRQERYYAGDTDGGCRVKYTAKVRDITNDAGEVVDRVRYGETMTVSGRMKKIRLTSLAALCGCRSQFGTRSHKLDAGASGMRGKKGIVSALIVCPLPDGGEFTTYIKGSASSGADLMLTNERSSGISFEITSLADSGACGSLTVRA